MNVLSVCEFESLPVVAVLDSPQMRAMTHREVDALHAIGSRLGIRIIEQVSRRYVRFQQFVGLVQVDGRGIELLPKIESAGEVATTSVVRHNLLKMLFMAADTTVNVPGPADSELSHVGWLDVFIRIFCDTLAAQVRKGIIKRYREERDDLAVVRGNILLDEQVSRNLVHRERVACEFDELDTDHPLNQTFKLALLKMLPCCVLASTQRMVRELAVEFDSVSLRPATSQWWRGVTLDRLGSRFQNALRMAQVFLDGTSPDVTAGGAASLAMLFDMGVLFEKYIGHISRIALASEGLKVHLQHARHFLGRWHDSGQRAFMLKPDIVVSRNHVPVCIGDTKWKRLANADRKLGVSQADLYQMLAYAGRYACDRVLLLYPYQRTADLAAPISRLLAFEEQSVTVLIAQVTLVDLSTVPLQLSHLFALAILAQEERPTS
ncbi:McrBC 5-methylcytosine restriction system component-like [Burkholderia pseudomallei]|nr:McrBC 5-methylcytosine restriction system component-like [Burkholderia pseudomallei]